MSLRIGCVPYLNARPLIYGIEDRVRLCTPAQLADLMYRGQLDAGLAPVAEVLLHDRYDVLDGIAIASRGPVKSVFLAHRQPIEKLTRVAVEPASRSSVWLLRVLLKKRYGIEPEFYPRPAGAKLSEHEAMMLIGDEALGYASRHPQPVWDLGAAWQEWTGLPFVYAVWAFQRGVTDGKSLLREAKANGLAHLGEIVQDAAQAQYLSQNVCYELGAAEKEGLRRFQRYLVEMRLIENAHDLRYVG